MLLDRRKPDDADRAQTFLTEARKLSESMGMQGLLDQIRENKAAILSSPEIRRMSLTVRATSRCSGCKATCS